MTAAFLLLAVTVIVGAFVQGSGGMGFALVFAPVAGLVAADLMPVALLALMLPLNGFVLWRERWAIDWSGVRWVSVARILCTPLGVWVLAIVPADKLGLLIGGSTVLAALVSLLAPDFKPGRGVYLGAGAVTAVTETATGVGGPPLALAYQHRPAPELRATVAACFLVGEIVSLALLLIQGKGSTSAMASAAALVPALAIGLWLSSMVHQRISSARLRMFVLIFAVVSGLLLMVR
ncbi:sulfite exporter TauE/SafE family protein [Calidifontibacter sp. DB0510]|uniref:Probable membrane transporter protein n=1 Tax=Metallococcus carri TaxID=1656884 RepID=A0A967AYU5_9MICO|nr:sulfite exporter TauE/SafE family protein [Metallococcus carri]NHN55581.1 sulfite exporter TauE/SafE family protein [Metallococcus carri]NOP38235.1 sulfite exporter TauE/SafE family protein [Calidifontibacter sp. DB2511S]